MGTSYAATSEKAERALVAERLDRVRNWGVLTFFPWLATIFYLLNLIGMRPLGTGYPGCDLLFLITIALLTYPIVVFVLINRALSAYHDRDDARAVKLADRNSIVMAVTAFVGFILLLTAGSACPLPPAY